jgi:serine/threonine protein kinase
MDKSDDLAGALLSPQITLDYNIISLLGKGGMGNVYLAEQLRVGRRHVALKVLNRSCCEDPDLKRRFENEAASAGRINHPNVVMVYECRATEDGQLYVAMEHVPGVDLGQVIAERGPLPLDEIVEITRQAAAGLGAAHKLGIVHRDIKPGNIMLGRDDEGALVVKVLDFGIARLSEHDASGSQTKTGVIMGTPHYMSPEQTLGQTGDKIDHRSDIYSLAMVVNQMLTGRTAFESESWVQVMYKHINEAPSPPSRLRPELANIGSIDQVVVKGLAKDREKRQQSAVEFARELAAACQTPLQRGGQDRTEPYPFSIGAEGTRFIPASQTEPIAQDRTTTPQEESAPTVLERSSPRHSTEEVDGQTTGSIGVAEKTAATGGAFGPSGAPVPGDQSRRFSSESSAAQVSATTAADIEGLVRGGGKKIAAAVSLVLLLGLAAAAFLVLRGSGRGATEVDPNAPALEAQATATSPPPEPKQAATTTTSPSPAAGKGNKNVAIRAQQAGGPTAPTTAPSLEQGGAKPLRNPHESEQAGAQPGPTPGAATEKESDSKGGPCLVVSVTGPMGKPIVRARVQVIDESSGTFEGLTGPLGKQRFCGLTAGHRVEIKVLGAAGKMAGTAERVLARGANSVSIQIRSTEKPSN